MQPVADAIHRRARLVSVVVPLFNEEDVAPLLLARLAALADQQREWAWEFVLVDDGSRDGTLAVLREAARRESRFRVISLSRNFGHQPAVTAGLDFAEGDVVAVIDGDLQDPPEMIPEMLQVWSRGADVVYAVKRTRKESLLLRSAYHVFYRVLRKSANIEIPLDSGDFAVMDRRVVDVLAAIPDRSRFIRGLRAWVGFHQVPFPYDRDSRQAGRPKYDLRRLLLLALDGLVSFSEAPLRIGLWLGASMIGLSVAYALAMLVWSIVTWETRAPGFATVLLAISFVGGVQLMVLSLLGEYVLRVFGESKGRPIYVVKERVDASTRTPAHALGIDASRPTPPT